VKDGAGAVRGGGLVVTVRVGAFVAAPGAGEAVVRFAGETGVLWAGGALDTVTVVVDPPQPASRPPTLKVSAFNQSEGDARLIAY
jgi:hypothetical protein